MMKVDVGDETAQQREPLHFDVHLEGLSPEYANLILNIKKVAEKVLFHWKTIPVVLPQPVVIAREEDGAAKKTINLRDVFLSPSFDEVDAVAFDAKGDPRMLSQKQLKSIREYGEFEVESLNFSCHFHRWRLNQIFQKGTHRTQETFLDDIALATRCILLTGWHRIISPFFSLSQSLLALQRGLSQFIDAIIGMPAFCNVDLATKLKEERSKYLVAELVVAPHLDEELEFLCHFIMQQIHKQKIEKYKLDLKNLPDVPYLYQTPKGFTVDLRLFNKDLMRKLNTHLVHHLEREARGWFMHFKEKIIAELKSQKLPDEDIEMKANAAIMDEYLRRVYEAILNDPEIEDLGTGLGLHFALTVLPPNEQEAKLTFSPTPLNVFMVGQLLIEQAQSTVLMHRAVENVKAQWNLKRAQLETALRASHPIRARIDQWLNEQLHNAEVSFMNEHRWLAQENALQACIDNQLNQAAMFLHRDLVFMREREDILLKELSRVRTPLRAFHWRLPIWFAKNWVVRKVYCGKSEIVPTKVVSTGTSSSCRIDPNVPVFLVEKQITSSTSTGWLFWRWRNYGCRLWAWLWNAMFIFGVIIPWCSILSFRALFSFTPFMPDLEAGSEGTLVPRRSSVTHTFCSRLASLWRHISKSRTEFESRVDRGFIGKGFSRHLNRFWNYVVKGVFGTILLALGFPIACVVLSSSSLLVALCAPLWIPLATLLFHFYCICIYDLDAADERQNRWCILLEALVWNILIQAFFQPLFAFLLATVVCPLVAVCIVLFSITRRNVRLLWDAIMFHAIIKRRGRIPAMDSILVKRVAGPGLTTDFYYQIIPEQALAAFEAKMELDELNAYHDEVERAIQRPQSVFSEFVKVCFQPFSGHLVRDGLYLFLEKEAAELRSFLEEKAERYKPLVTLNLDGAVVSKVKMTPPDLKVTTKLAANMLEKFYPSRVISRLPADEEEFWENRGLAFRDWSGIAIQMLSEIFSSAILVPLKESDVHYKLGIQNVNLSRFTEMILAAESQGDLDVVGTVHSPKATIQVHSPYLNVAIFNPICKKEAMSSNKRNVLPWKSHQKPSISEKMKIPLPLPSHPVHIAVVIYNREADDPIPLEDEACQSIVKAIEDSVGSVASNFVDVDLTPADSPVDKTEDDGQDGSPAAEDYSENSRGCSRRNSATVNLASSEDITLEPDGERVTYSHSSYSTMV